MNKNHLVLLLLLFTFLIFIVFSFTIQKSNNTISFVTKLDENTIYHLNYFIQNLSALDRYVRPNLNNYITKHIRSISYGQKQIIDTDIRFIDDMLISKGFTKKLIDIPWKCAILVDGIENNLAHTFNDIIFLPITFFEKSSFKRRITLLHEKIHIYQRLYPIEVNKLFMHYWEIYPFDTIYNRRIQDPLLRSNPDLNEIIYTYYDPNLMKYTISYCRYNDSPKNISDSYVYTTHIDDTSSVSKSKPSDSYYNIITNYSIHQTEHPNEVMACLVPEIVLNNRIDEKTMNWLKQYL